jgi:hypothetical protein
VWPPPDADPDDVADEDGDEEGEEDDEAAALLEQLLQQEQLIEEELDSIFEIANAINAPRGPDDPPEANVMAMYTSPQEPQRFMGPVQVANIPGEPVNGQLPGAGITAAARCRGVGCCGCQSVAGG